MIKFLELTCWNSSQSITPSPFLSNFLKAAAIFSWLAACGSKRVINFQLVPSCSFAAILMLAQISLISSRRKVSQ